MSKWVVLALCIVATQSVQIRVIYDDFFAHSVQEYWKRPLDLFLRQLGIQYQYVHLKISNLHPQWRLTSEDVMGTVLLTNCKASQILSRKVENVKLFRIDLVPCEGSNLKSGPLTWARENVFCLFMKVRTWIEDLNSKVLQSTLPNFTLTERSSSIPGPTPCVHKPLKTRYSNEKRMLDSARLHVKGKVIRTGVANIPPASFVKVAANGTVVSFTGMIPVIPKDRSLGIYENGSWTGIVNMVLKGECDIASAPFYFTQDRFQVIRYSSYLVEDVNTILIRAPQEDIKLWTAVTIYDWQVWLCLLGTMGILSVVFWLFFKVFQLEPNELEIHWLYLIRILISQAEDFQGTRVSARSLAAIWCLAGVVVVNVYTSTLMSSLIVPVVYPAADSLQDLAYRSNLEPFAKRGTSWETLILHSEIDAMKVIAQQFRTNPSGSWVNTFEEAISRVLKGGSAFLSTESILEFYSGADLDTNKRCRLYQTKYAFQKSFSAGIMAIDAPSNDAFNYAVHLLHAHGFTAYVSAPSLSARRVRTACRILINQVSESKKLGLAELLSAFIILAIGLLAASLAILCENLTLPFSRWRSGVKSLHLSLYQ